MITIAEYMKPQDFFVEAHIADIHFGVMDPYTTYKILMEQFIAPLRDMQTLDIVSVDGDLFEHKFMASSDAVVYAIYFVQALVEVCKQKNATLLLISGTGSHDADQMRLFYPYMKRPDVDVRVIMSTGFEYVKGKRILCVPEQYNKGEDYYNGFLFRSGTYDACYMHGTIKGGIVGKNERDLDSNREPVFDEMDFGGCLGPIISGHNHVHSTYASNSFFYVGSPIRWRFGEEQTKGWILLFHNIRERWFKVHFEPIQSFRYDTLQFGDLMKSDPNTIIQYIEQVKSSGIDYLRIQFTVNDGDKIALLRSYYRNRRDIVLENIAEKQRRDLVQEKLDSMDLEQKQMMETLSNPNLTPEEKLVVYMNKKNGDSYWTTELFTKFMEDVKKL